MQVLPDSMKEAVHIYRDSVIPAAEEQQGFRGALMLTDSDTGVGISVSLWESEADMLASEASGFFHKQIEKLDALFTNTPVRKHYEVSVGRFPDASWGE